MNEHSDRTAESPPTTTQNIAPAPGQLAMPEVEARYEAQRWQFRHDNTIAPLSPRPGAPVIVSATSGVEAKVEAACIFYTVDRSVPQTSSIRIPMEISEVTWDSRTGYLKRWSGKIPAQSHGTSVRYRIGGWHRDSGGQDPDQWAHDGQGFWFHVPNESGITTFAYPVEDAVSPMPAWMDDAIVYHIFLDRFHPGTDDGIFRHIPQPCKRHGGTLRGVLRSLPYLADLGVNCLWFSPLHPSETYHRYDGMDFFGVDPDLGTEQDLRTLIDTAHALGMRIWLDFVPAHCSWHHPAFLAAQQDQQADTYSWFTFNEWPDDYRSFLQVARTLPSFDTNDPDARAYLIDSAMYWLREFGVDGFRLDHAIAPSMDFWLAFRQATEAARPDVVNVGEATDTPDCLRRYRGKLHGYLDFELARAFRLTFGTGDWTVGQFDGWLGSYEQYMDEGPGRISFLDNHDMDRFLWIAGNDRASLKLAALCQFTLGATPVIYYGTEIGMTQLYGSAESGFGGDENARGDMPWDDAFWDRDMLAFYRQLIRMRKEQPVLGRGRRQAVHTSDEDATYVYLRCSSVEGVSASDILVVLNLGDNEAAIRLPGNIVVSGLDCVVCTKDAPTWRNGHMVVARKSGATFVIG